MADVDQRWPGLVLPVGHRLGELHDPSSPGPRQVVVRHGSTAELLTPEDSRVWERAHAGGEPSGARAVAVARRLLGLGVDPDEAVPRLVARGLLVHVDPRDDDAPRVSATVRARPSGQATGAAPDGTTGFGLPGLPPLTRLTGRHVDVWLAAVLATDLRRAAAGVQALWAEDLDGAPGPDLERRVLVDLWDVVAQMVSAGAGHLDTAG